MILNICQSFNQIDCKNVSFTGKRFSFQRGFISKLTERAQVILKNSTRNFQNSPPFERSACFYVTISGNFELFQLEYRFLVESIKVTATDIRYFLRSKFSRSLVHKKNFSLIYDKQFSSQDTYFVKRDRIPVLSLNELGKKSQATIILGKFKNKP